MRRELSLIGSLSVAALLALASPAPAQVRVVYVGSGHPAAHDTHGYGTEFSHPAPYGYGGGHSGLHTPYGHSAGVGHPGYYAPHEYGFGGAHSGFPAPVLYRLGLALPGSPAGHAHGLGSGHHRHDGAPSPYPHYPGYRPRVYVIEIGR